MLIAIVDHDKHTPTDMTATDLAIERISWTRIKLDVTLRCAKQQPYHVIKVENWNRLRELCIKDAR